MVKSYALEIIFKVLFFYISLFAGINSILAQESFPFSLYLDTSRIDPNCQLHSFAYGRIENQLYFFGGRKDGIHGKESGFESSGSNNNLIIYDLITKSANLIPLSDLDQSLFEPLTSSSTNFCQKDDKLYIIGGYSQNSKKIYLTHSSLIQVDLPLLKQLIKSKQPIKSAFQQYISDTFAIAGGQLKYINGNFYLAGGHRFDGAYSQDARKYRQEYTDCCWVFKIYTDSSGIIKVSFISKIFDELNFHRRDFNLCPIITSDGKIEPVAFSGVFMVNDARPFFNISSIQESGFTDINNFNQQLANYQCAHIGLYSAKNKKMNELFFGGMAEFYFNSKSELVRDPLVPFVKTISRVEADHEGNYTEYALSSEMPGFIGTNSEFILNSSIPIISDEIIHQDSILSDTSLLGWIVGGLVNHSAKANPWQDSTIEFTSANPFITEVRLVRKAPNSNRDYVLRNTFTKVNYFPNPVNDEIFIQMDEMVESINLWILDASGKIVKKPSHKNSKSFYIDLHDLPNGVYHCYYALTGRGTGKFEFVKQ